MPVILISLAFFVSLFIQSVNTPLVGDWVLLYVAGCLCALYRGNYSYPKSIVWYVVLGWAAWLGIDTFILSPVVNGAAYMWILLGMPAIALTLQARHLKPLITAFYIIILLFAIGLILQMVFHVRYTAYENPGRYAWPLVDPNNASAVVNIALVGSFYKALKSWKWWLPTAVLALAMVAAGSKAGLISAAICCGMALVERLGSAFMLAGLGFGMLGLAAIFFIFPDIIVVFCHSFGDRLPIWEDSWQLVWAHPWTGLGLGTFHNYYATVRTETYTSGWHSHNDLLQFAIELGVPGFIIFSAACAAIIATTRRDNFVAAICMLSVFLESMVEFQFYIPAVSFPLGLALCYHILNSKVDYRGKKDNNVQSKG